MELIHRKNHRLKNFDYGSCGYYFITICTLNKGNTLCVPDAIFTPTEIGKKVVDSFNKIAVLNENVEIQKFVLMPNHIHAIIIIKNTELVEIKEKKYDFEITERRGRRSLRRIITIFFPFYRIFVDITPYIIIMLLVFNYFIIK